MFFKNYISKQVQKEMEKLQSIKVIDTSDKAPISKGKDYKQDASNYLKECFDAGIDPPKGYYYYTSPSIMHGFKGIDLIGCYFYTDKNVPFLYVRGENGSLTGFPIIDVNDVKETDSTGVIVMQHYSEHLQNAIIEARIISDYPQVTEGGFKGIVWDGSTPFKTDYKKGDATNCESHWCTIRLYSKRLKKAIEVKKTNGSNGCHNEIWISDMGSAIVLDLDNVNDNQNIYCGIQAMHSLTEQEKENASIVLNSENNLLQVQYSDFKGDKHSEKYLVYRPFYVIENNGQFNKVVENWNMLQAKNYGKVKGKNELIYVAQ